MDGTDPALAWRIFLRILGFKTDLSSRNAQIRRTVLTAGQVLDDIDLDIEKGSVVCLEGASGSGKSVLLRIVSGVLPPTSGRIEIHGRLSSLLGSGGNLDDRLTARENIEMQRRLRGLPAEEADAFVQQVVEFAELEKFVDVPVRTFSTGMGMRLSLALAMLGKPEILVVDDVLTVGDIAFQNRCVERLMQLRDEGVTMLLAFSDQTLVRRLATRVVRLRGGRIVFDGAPGSLNPIHAHGGTRNVTWDIDAMLPANETIAMTAIAVVEAQQRDGGAGTLSVALSFDAVTAPMTCRPSIILMRNKVVVFRSLLPEAHPVEAAGPLRFSVAMPVDLLAEGDYALSVSMQTEHGGHIHSLKALDVVRLEVRRGADTVSAGEPLAGAPLRWDATEFTMAEAAA